jgi:hypothetical protein
MPDHDSSLSSTPEANATDECAQADNQLAFAFAKREAEATARVPASSRQEIQHPGRSLRAPRIARPLEEIQLELDVLGYMPSGKVLILKLTDNRHTIVSVQRGRDAYRVRIHRMFASAEPRQVRALARYIVHNDKNASTQLSAFIERHQHLVSKPPRAARRMVMRTSGQVHDLAVVFDRLNRRFFSGKHEARITWGPSRRRPNQRSIKVGSYSLEDGLIRVHPALDNEGVPAYFVEWIVFHEMLHGKHAIREVGGRRCFHPPEFARDERRFPDYGRARLWEKANIDQLLGC